MNIRPFKPNDIDYVVQSHFEIYSKEYELDETFRDYVREAAYQFLETYDAEKENLWIVEERWDLKI